MRWLMVLVFICSVPLYANKHDETYHKANKALKTGQYQDALEGYQSLEPQGPVVLYNTGIALFHLQHYGKAVAAWCKAEQHARPGLLKKIQYNKNKAYSKLDLEEPAWWQNLLLTLQSYFSLFLLQVLFLGAWLSWCFARYIRIELIRKYRAFLLVFSILCGCLLIVKYWVQEYKRAIIIAPQAKLFTGPNVDFDAVAEMKEGDSVGVVQKEDTWYKVNYNNAHGWIQSVNLEQVN